MAQANEYGNRGLGQWLLQYRAQIGALLAVITLADGVLGESHQGCDSV